MTMGEMGNCCFVDPAGQRGAGAGWPTRWSYSFDVASIDAAVEKIKHVGGAVSQELHQVPGGMHTLHGTAHQDAAFALVGGK